MTNLIASVAYKAAVVQLILGEANHASLQLNLPTPHPIEATNIIESFVGAPRFGFSGSIYTTNFSFGVGHDNAKLWRITRMENGMDAFSTEMVHELKELRPKSLIDETGAYKLSTQWLSAISVNIPALEKKRALSIRHVHVQSTTDASGYVFLPIYVVAWGNTNDPDVQVTILGSTKELLELVINNTSFSSRPPLVVTNADELQNQPAPSTIKDAPNQKGTLDALKKPDK